MHQNDLCATLKVKIKTQLEAGYTHTHSLCVTGCERSTWEVAELCWSKNTGSFQPWATSVHTTEPPWSKVSDTLLAMVLPLSLSKLGNQHALDWLVHFLSSQVCCQKDTCVVLGMVHVSTLQQETSRTSQVWTACLPSRWPSPPVLSLTTFPALSLSLRTIKKCTHGSCLFAPGQGWKGQGDHSC